jgi:hypothetical protein
VRSERPVPLDKLERDQMHQISGAATANVKEANDTLATARDFLVTAQHGVADGRYLPAVSNYHEAARLAITAVATSRGRRFSNLAGSHEAVVDYALGVGLTDADGHAMLDQLRELRHQVNYPADLIEPSERDVRRIGQMVEALVDEVTERLTPPAPKPKRIPPPPR